MSCIRKVEEKAQELCLREKAKRSVRSSSSLSSSIQALLSVRVRYEENQYLPLERLPLYVIAADEFDDLLLRFAAVPVEGNIIIVTFTT